MTKEYPPYIDQVLDRFTAALSEDTLFHIYKDLKNDKYFKDMVSDFEQYLDGTIPEKLMAILWQILYIQMTQACRAGMKKYVINQEVADEIFEKAFETLVEDELP